MTNKFFLSILILIAYIFFYSASCIDSSVKSYRSLDVYQKDQRWYLKADAKPINGYLIRLWPNGYKKSRIRVKEGFETTPLTEWYQNGKKKREIRDLENRSGTLTTLWDIHGNLTETVELREGIKHGFRTRYYVNRKLQSVVEYRKGTQFGRVRFYHPKGSLEFSGLIENSHYSHPDGKPFTGSFIIYNRQMKREKEYRCKNGKLNGVITTWKRGRIQKEESFESGQLTNAYIYLYGELYKVKQYKNGKLIKETEIDWTAKKKEKKKKKIIYSPPKD